MSDKDFFDQFTYDPAKDLLGSGGFGSVYRAYDRREKRFVAIKISQVKDLFGKFTLLNEVELSRKIDDHTNVARYEFGLRVMYPFPVDYAVMAYYEEGNLEMLLRKRHGILTPQEKFEIVEGILEGIGHLHGENIIHRDIKLANILMHRTKQGHWRPKLADFGLSRELDEYDASIANSAIGITLAYAAPEQIENRVIRRNVDLWAFGVILYRLLTGEMPFSAKQGADSTSANIEISRKITQMELPDKLNILPEPYQSIIRRCWVKDIKDRAQTASELLDILKGRAPFSSSGTTFPASDILVSMFHSVPDLGTAIESFLEPNNHDIPLPSVSDVGTSLENTSPLKVNKSKKTRTTPLEDEVGISNDKKPVSKVLIKKICLNYALHKEPVDNRVEANFCRMCGKKDYFKEIYN
jgi:serine/threonine protein kinase